MARTADSTRQRKKAMLAALDSEFGNVSEACKLANVGRSTHYEWIDKDPEYAQAIQDIAEGVIDFAESALRKQIENGNHVSTIFFLKTKGKQRGYVEGAPQEMPPIPQKERDEFERELRLVYGDRYQPPADPDSATA